MAIAPKIQRLCEALRGLFGPNCVAWVNLGPEVRQSFILRYLNVYDNLTK